MQLYYIMIIVSQVSKNIRWLLTLAPNIARTSLLLADEERLGSGAREGTSDPRVRETGLQLAQVESA